MTPVLVVGLTGRLGAGKSTVGRLLAGLGATVIDTDQVARDVMAPGSELEALVKQRFGPSVTAPDGSVDRRALARTVFADATRRAELEALTHPAIRAGVTSLLATAPAPVAVVEVPLLDAARKRQYGLDAVVLVDVPGELGLQRAVARGMGEHDARARAAAQPTDEERRSLADFTVHNDGDLAHLRQQVLEVWDQLAAMARDRSVPRPGGLGPGRCPSRDD